MVAVRGYRWDHRWRTGAVLLAITAALVSALAFVEPARADDGSGAPADAAAVPESEPSQPTDQPTTDVAAAPESEPPAAADPETTPSPEPPPESTPQEPSSTGEAPAEPAPAEEPAGDVVTLEPEAPPVVVACTEPGGAEDAQSGTCEAPGEDAEPAESPPADCSTAAAGDQPAACPEQTPTPPPAAPAATAPKVAATPTAQPAAPTPAAIVVSLAPPQSAAAPAIEVAVADVAVERNDAAELSPRSDAPVELVRVPVRVARLVEAFYSSAAPKTAPAGVLAPPIHMGPMIVPSAPITIRITAAALGGPGARAAPGERDGHQEVTTEAEPQPSAAVDPQAPFDDRGPGASGGSAGGAPGSAASSRHFAIAATPLRVGFPSAFAFAPLPSSVPEGALEDAPTARPG